MRLSNLLWTLGVSNVVVVAVPATADATSNTHDVMLGTRALHGFSERSLEARNILTELLHVLADVGDIVTCVACEVSQTNCRSDKG